MSNNDYQPNQRGGQQGSKSDVRTKTGEQGAARKNPNMPNQPNQKSGFDQSHIRRDEESGKGSGGFSSNK